MGIEYIKYGNLSNRLKNVIKSYILKIKKGRQSSSAEISMKTFKDYLSENEGTYASLNFNHESSIPNKIYEFCKDLGIKNLDDPKDYHCTVVYSKVGIPRIKDLDVHFPIHAKIIGWDVFGESKILVLLLDCKGAEEIFEVAMQMGASYDFPQYKAHISIAKGYSGELPPKYPIVPIVFDYLEVSPLDEEK